MFQLNILNSCSMIEADAHRKTMKQSIILGVYLMLTYLTYLSFSNIITFIDQHQQGQEADGPIILAVTNIVFLVVLIYTPLITNFKRQFQIAALCHFITYAIFIPDFRGGFNLLVGIIGGFFTGYGGAVYWVSQGGYMMKLFRTYNIQPNQQGKYFGVMNGVMSVCNLLGAAVTTFGLGLFGNQVYFTILSVLALLSWAVCTYFLDDLEDQSLENYNSKKQNEAEIQNKIEKEAEINNVQSVEEQKDEFFDVQQVNKPLAKEMKVMKTVFLKTMSYYPKMYYIILVIVIDGIMLGFTSIYLNKLLPQDQRTDLKVGYLLMVQGIGCVIGSLTSAFACDRFNVINVILVGITIICLTCLATFLNEFLNFQSLYYPFVVAFMWGFTNSYIESWENVSCARINKGCLESFSIVQQITGLTYVCFTIAMIISNNTVNTSIFFIVFMGIGVLSIIILLLFKKKSEKQHF